MFGLFPHELVSILSVYNVCKLFALHTWNFRRLPRINRGMHDVSYRVVAPQPYVHAGNGIWD